MQDSEITFMWKARSCWAGDCPALFRAPGGYYVQAKRVTDPAVLAQLQAIGAANDSPLAADEVYGFVDADVIDRIRELP